MQNDSSGQTLLIGMGNRYLSDDAVGIQLVSDFSRKLETTPDLTIIEECSVGGLELLDLIADYERLIVVDSIKTRGGIPGNWYHFTAEKLRETMNLSNVHDVNFATALELGRRLGMSIPSDSDNHIFAVEILDNLTFGERLTHPLQKTYPIYSAGIFEEIRSLIRGNLPSVAITNDD